MPVLGGSPLGLIGVLSSPDREGNSTFNGGATRNVNVNMYNTAYESENGTRSLFSGPTFATMAPYATSGKITPQATGGELGLDPYKGIKRSTLHNNDIYDTSVLNIIEKLAGTKAALRPADFAYQRDTGVYPNNRLMIARRFASPQPDNIFGKGNVPIAIMLSWKPQDEDFLKITFGEEWTYADADFTKVLNSMGEDFLMKGVGDKLGGGIGAIPLPGFTETLQRSFLRKIGVFEDTGTDLLPSGNPNLIKSARRRKTIGYGSEGSGLKCDVSIQMTCVWEQKFISGIDPTVAWQDIISRVGIFGTSNSQNYGLTKTFEDNMRKWMDRPQTIVSDLRDHIKDSMTVIRDEVVSAYAVVKEDGISFASGAVVQRALDHLSIQLNKYRIELEGIVRALSGAPSAPWHITLGNPMKPFFCSGDMLVENVDLKFGAKLAFNDLPHSIEATFTLKNARPWGLQEIMAKFNSGNIRVLSKVKTSDDLNPGQELKEEAPLGTETPPLPNNGQVDSGSVYVNPGTPVGRDYNNESFINRDVFLGPTSL